VVRVHAARDEWRAMVGDKRDIAAGVAASILFLAFWLVGGPGPKYEEGVAALFVGLCIWLVGAIASILRPRLLINPVLYPGLWFAGSLCSRGQIVSLYDYAYFTERAFGVRAQWVGIGVYTLLVINAVSLGFRIRSKGG